jgi:hypothetical protein
LFGFGQWKGEQEGTSFGGAGRMDLAAQSVQPVFRNGVAKLLDVPRGIGEAPLIRQVQRSMNIGALMQDLYDVEQRSLDENVIRLRRPG